MTTYYTLTRRPGREAAAPASRSPRLQPIATARHSRDAECPDAGWKRLTNKQKARLSMLARKAYAAQKVQGIDLDEWRHEVSISACGVRISEATQSKWADLKTAFQDLAGNPVGAMRTQIREADNKRRIALYKLTKQLEAHGLESAYAEKICRDTFKVPISQASAKQIWCLFFTVRNRKANKEWLLKYLRERGLGEQDNYSVGVCSSCGNRSLWGGRMTGQRITTCRQCGIQQRHYFEDFSPANATAQTPPDSGTKNHG